MDPLSSFSFLVSVHSLAQTLPRAGAKELNYWLGRLDMPHGRISGNVRDWPFSSPPPGEMISGPLALNWGISNLPVI